VPLVDGFFASGHEPPGITTQMFGMPLRVSSAWRNGMGGHNHW